MLNEWYEWKIPMKFKNATNEKFLWNLKMLRMNKTMKIKNATNE